MPLRAFSTTVLMPGRYRARANSGPVPSGRSYPMERRPGRTPALYRPGDRTRWNGGQGEPRPCTVRAIVADGTAARANPGPVPFGRPYPMERRPGRTPALYRPGDRSRWNGGQGEPRPCTVRAIIP